MKAYYFLKDEYIAFLEKRKMLQKKLRYMQSYKPGTDVQHEPDAQDADNKYRHEAAGTMISKKWVQISYAKRRNQRDKLQLEHERLKRILLRAKVFRDDVMQQTWPARKRVLSAGIGRCLNLQIQNIPVQLVMWGYRTLYGRLSYSSPLGRALLWRSAGSEVQIRCGDEMRTVKLVSIS